MWFSRCTHVCCIHIYLNLVSFQSQIQSGIPHISNPRFGGLMVWPLIMKPLTLAYLSFIKGKCNSFFDISVNEDNLHIIFTFSKQDLHYSYGTRAFLGFENGIWLTCILWDTITTGLDTGSCQALCSHWASFSNAFKKEFLLNCCYFHCFRNKFGIHKSSHLVFVLNFRRISEREIAVVNRPEFS